MAKILENQNNGKSEAWYFLENNGKIKVSNKNKDIIKSLDTEEWNESLEEVFLDKGDLIFVPAGTVHALCEGSTILEIQQSSDVTYRLYDWGRPREIHVEKAKKVLENIETSYVISRKCENFETKFFSVQTIKNLKRKGFGIYVNLKTYETIVLSENVEYFFEGEYIEFKK
jgi:mannose-6-phosphate isomerase